MPEQEARERPARPRAGVAMRRALRADGWRQGRDGRWRNERFGGAYNEENAIGRLGSMAGEITAAREERTSSVTKEATMADAKTLAAAIARRLELPVIPPRQSSSDGLPENAGDLEAADDELLEAFALAADRVSRAELIEALRGVPR